MVQSKNVGSRTAHRRKAARKVQVANSHYQRIFWHLCGVIAGVLATALFLASYDLSVVKCMRIQIQEGPQQCFATQIYGVGIVVSAILTVYLIIWTILRMRHR
jgi:hypothetical protein